MSKRIIVIGAGGHAKTLADTILKQGAYQLVGFSDSNVAIGTDVFLGYKVLLSQDELMRAKDLADCFVVGIGDNGIRKQLFQRCSQFLSPAVVLHPRACVAADVSIGGGSVVLANATINASSCIGENTIINSGVVVDHDSQIGASVHLSIGTMVGSNSNIKEGYLSSIGENIPSFSNIGL